MFPIHAAKTLVQPTMPHFPQAESLAYVAPVFPAMAVGASAALLLGSPRAVSGKKKTLFGTRRSGSFLEESAWAHALIEAPLVLAVSRRTCSAQPLGASMPMRARNIFLTLGSSLLTLVHVSPERLHAAVRWLSMHSPFWIVHLRVRRSCVEGGSLPSVVPRGSGLHRGQLQATRTGRGVPTQSILLK